MKSKYHAIIFIYSEFDTKPDPRKMSLKCLFTKGILDNNFLFAKQVSYLGRLSVRETASFYTQIMEHIESLQERLILFN